MLSRKTWVIAKREFVSRLKTKGFWISTVALPLLMAAWLILPTLIMTKTRSSLHLAVVDETGGIAQALGKHEAEIEAGEGDQGVDLTLEIVEPQSDGAALKESLDDRIRAEEIDAWLWISPESLEANELEYHGRNVSNFLTLEILERTLSRIVREERLAGAGYDTEEIAALTEGIDLATVRVTEEGTEADTGAANLILAVGLFFTLYMALIIYGNLVMQGVLEEKSNRVVEVVVSTVKPTELMGGKLLGIGAVGITQLLIWVVSGAALTAPGLITAIATLPEGMRLPSFELGVMAHFLALFVLGYVMYAAFYALIGSAFNSPQEAQQLAGVAVMFLIAPMVFFMPVLNDPDSLLSTILSLIPPFTPLVMMLRIAVKMPPLWEVALGYALSIGFAVFMVWLCARVYRIGILMYGKRPTIQEIWKWMRYA